MYERTRLQGPDDPRHGTLNAYRRHGCRCERCRTANAAADKAAANRRAPLGPGDPRHGTLTGYTAYRCRCKDCSAARRAYIRSLKESGPKPREAVKVEYVDEWETYVERFWAKVEPTGFCWYWTGSAHHQGYGEVAQFGARRKSRAYRVAYEILIGPIPTGLEIDHLCRNPRCVNPDHLEPVTHTENQRRAPRNVATIKRNKTHCPAGHPYSGDNLYLNPKGRRECRACRRARRRREALVMHVTDLVLLFVGGPALLILAGYELYAIKDRTPGNTYSERTREWFRTNTKGGAYGFLALLGAGGGALLVWFAAHIVKIPV